MQDTAINFLKTHKGLFSLSYIEYELGMPKSTLIKALNKSQSLPNKWSGPLSQYFAKIKRDLPYVMVNVDIAPIDKMPEIRRR